MEWRVTSRPGKVYFTFFSEPRTPFPLPAMKNRVKRAYQLAAGAPVKLTSENGRTYLNVDRRLHDDEIHRGRLHEE